MNDPKSCTARQLPFFVRSSTALPISILFSLAFTPIETASAQESGFVERYSAQQTAGRQETDAKPDPLKSNPLFAVVSIADQRISVYGSDGLLARSAVSTGVRGHSTPTGIFSIIQKQRWHQSNIYSGAPMPFMQRITWSGVALHAGVVPGHPASHGCIRLPGSFAQRLFSATEMGQRVIVAPSDTTPVEIAHKTLPSPILSPAPSPAVSGTPEATGTVQTAEQNGGAAIEPASLSGGTTDAVRLNPIEFAKLMRSEANLKARAAGRATKEAMLLSARKTSELRIAARKLDAAEGAAADAARELAAANRRLERTDGKEEIAEAAEAKTRAEAALIEAQKAGEARIAKANEAKSQAEAALSEAQKTAEASLAKATDAKTQAEAALAEAQKAGEAGIAKAAEARSQAEAALPEARKTAEANLAKASEAKAQAETAVGEAKKAGEANIAKANEAKSQAEAALAEAQKAGDQAAIAKAADAKNQAEAASTEAQNAAEAGLAKATEAKTQAEAALIDVQKAGETSIAKATEAKSQAETAVTEARKAVEASIAKAAEAKGQAEAALVQTRKSEDARVAKAAEARKDAEAAVSDAQKAADARVAKATEAKSRAEADLIGAQKAEETRIAKATEAKSKAEAALTEAKKVVEEARAAKDAKEQELAEARKAADEAKAAGKAAAKAMDEAARRIKPLSVFISRKTGKLYVRQNFVPVFEAPVTIRDADREIGTHIFVSTRASDDGSALHWQAVSMPAAERSEDSHEGKSRRRAKNEAPDAAPAPVLEPETAQGALDRVTIPEDTARRLAELAWVGASVIISDNGISGETGPTTDFIILTRSKAASR